MQCFSSVVLYFHIADEEMGFDEEDSDEDEASVSEFLSHILCIQSSLNE